MSAGVRPTADLAAVERGLLDALAEVALCRRWAEGITPLMPPTHLRAAYGDLARAVAQVRERLGAVERMCRVLHEETT
jgi:hypothetical protein